MILSNDSYSVRTNTSLDCGADSTLVREYIAKILQLKGEKKPLKIQNAFLDSGRIESKLENFTILSNHHPQKIQINKAWSIPNFSISHTSYSTQELEKKVPAPPSDRCTVNNFVRYHRVNWCRYTSTSDSRRVQNREVE